MEHVIALAVPVFFLLMGIELLVNWRRGRTRYALQDTINNLSCGIGQQLVGLALKGTIFVVYVALYERYALLSFPSDSVLAWTAAIVGVDFCYYWFHRAGHRVNAVWSAHAVHHQSEEMNLSVALRQSWTALFVTWVFYLPLALLGVPPTMFLVANIVMTLYQFWIHTEAIDRIGPLEWVLNTASHHRVHHGVNPIYIDKNYAGIFIVWDRLFGTFEPEAEEVVYGTVKPLRSWNPLWANLEYWVITAQTSFSARRWRDKLWAWVAPPEWRPAEQGGNVTIPAASRATQVKYGVTVPRGLTAYVTLQFLVVLVGCTILLGYHARLDPAAKYGLIGLGLTSLVSLGALLEAKRWGPPLEVGRVLALAGLAAWLTWSQPVLVAVWGGVAALSLGWLVACRGHFAAPAQACSPLEPIAAASAADSPSY